MNLVVLGPPGSGKGTQAALLASHFGLHHLSTGDLLRDEVRSRSQLGATARPYLDSGHLVPDEIVLRAVRQRLARLSSNRGFVLDGFPRNLSQALALENALQKAHLPLSRAVAIHLSDEAVLNRLKGRLSCPQCHAIFHLHTKPPRVDRLCDDCGTRLVRRHDEQPSTLRQRLKDYASETEPVLSFYRERKALVEVPGDGTIEQVNQHILSALRCDSHDTVEN